ncbi:MAG: DUF4861 domain-containing protein [Cytophagaceae bacterium]|nr:MAG: DUF4861 domain-containing protein [Cytophagaceae bacterium]
MKNLLTAFITLFWVISSGRAQSTIQITNPVNVPLSQEVVAIPWATVVKVFPAIDTTNFQVMLAGGQQPLAYQLEHQGQKDVQNLLVQVSIGPSQSIRLIMRKGKPALVTPKTYGRYVPERFDDFAWENDRVAFRIYGAALNGRSDNAFGTDIWAKRTNQLILNKWYKQNDYHNDHGEGLDYYHVGLTLGAGDIAVFLHDSLQFIHNYRSWEILDNGPLRTTFRVRFDPYTFNGVVVQEVRTVSLDAGSQLSKVVIHIEQNSGKVLPMVVGISQRKEPSPVVLDEKSGVLGYWEPKHGNDGTLGIGCVFPVTPVRMLKKYDHLLARIDALSVGDLIYYTGGAWDKAVQITSAEAWFAYLRQFNLKRKQPPIIRVVN